jgi:hypothetical protein
VGSMWLSLGKTFRGVESFDLEWDPCEGERVSLSLDCGGLMIMMR